jgi:hypothetical protein
MFVKFLVVCCEECEMWRLLYSPRKLSSAARQELATILDNYTFTCGASLNDLELPSTLTEVCVRDLQCYNAAEKFYYSMKYDPICEYCSSEDSLMSAEGCYPQCAQCQL